MAQISTQKEKKNLSLILYVNNNQDSPFCWNRHDDGQEWQQPHVSLNSAPESPTTQHCNEILMLFVKNTHNLRVKPKSQHSTQQRAASFAAVLAYDGKDSCVDAVHNLKNVLGVWGCFCFLFFCNDPHLLRTWKISSDNCSSAAPVDGCWIKTQRCKQWTGGHLFSM